MKNRPMFYDRFETGEIKPPRGKAILFGIVMAMLMVEFLCFGWATFRIMSGYHSIDLVSDVRLVIDHYDGDAETALECNLGGDCFSLSETYRQGWLMLFQSVISAIVASILFALTLCLLSSLALEGMGK